MTNVRERGAIFRRWDNTFLKYTPWLKDRWTFAVAEVAILGMEIVFPAIDFITRTWNRKAYVPSNDMVYTTNTPTHRTTIFCVASDKGIFTRPRGFFNEWHIYEEESIPEFVLPVFDKGCSRKERKKLLTKMIKLRAFL